MKPILGLVFLPVILSMLFPASVSGQGDFRIFVTDDDAIHELDLKATEGQNGEVNQVSGFAIEANSVVQINQNENLQIFTSTNEPERIEKVKVTDQGGQLIELTKSGNQWLLQGFDDGVYLLDVIVNMPSGEKGAFETVLVILAPNTQNADPNQVIKQVVKTDTKVVFRDQKPKPKPIGNPYCDLVSDDYRGACHDRKDYDEVTGLYLCRDGSDVKDWRDCKDAGKHPAEIKYPKQRICTAGMDAVSLACAEGITVERYCTKNPQTQGCPGTLTPPLTDPCVVPSSIECVESMAEVQRRAAALGIPTPQPMPTPESGCQPEDDFCGEGCESPTMDCIDDVNIGDDGVDSVPDEEVEEEETNDDDEPEEEEKDENEGSDNEENADEEEDTGGSEGEGDVFG